MKLYGEISKTEELDDGTIKVWGYASTGSVDSDGETITPDAMKAALPDYMKFGAVREMHKAWAAGTAIEANVQDDGRTWFGAHVVDSEAVKKVRAGVYKGFSVGGKVTSRDELNKSVIKGVKLTEISLVDRPANPEATFTMFKADGAADESAVGAIAEILNSGAVSPAELLDIAKGMKDAKDAEKTNGMTKAEAVEELRKYASGEQGKEIEDASRAMSALDSIRWLLFAEQAEREETPENAAQVEILTGVIAALKRFIVSELMENESGEAEGEEKEASAKSSDLNKAGARFSASTRDALSKCHDAMKAAVDHLDKLGYQSDEEPEGSAEKSAQADDLRKAFDLEKAEISDKLTKAEARIKELESQPDTSNMPAAMVVEKSAGFAAEEKKDEPKLIYKADGSVDEQATRLELMKFAIQPDRAQRVGF